MKIALRCEWVVVGAVLSLAACGGATEGDGRSGPSSSSSSSSSSSGASSDGSGNSDSSRGVICASFAEPATIEPSRCELQLFSTSRTKCAPDAPPTTGPGDGPICSWAIKNPCPDSRDAGADAGEAGAFESVSCDACIALMPEGANKPSDCSKRTEANGQTVITCGVCYL